jgi:translation initiation factor 2 subunit 1
LGSAMADFLTKGRYYEAEFPEVEDVIVVQINKINDKIGAYVSLLEYDNREAMIPITEISKRRIRSMAKLLRIGSTEVCMVVSVDKQKGYINCSKKRVTSEDVAPKLEAFAKAKAIHGVMQHTASTNNIPIEELCTKVAWPLDAQFGNALDAFKKHINGELQIWDHVDFSQPGVDLSDQQEKLKADIESVLQRRLITSSMRLQAKCEVSCSEYEGIDAIKAA